MLLAILLALSSYGFAQSTQVTFYVHGSRLKSGVPGTNTGIFYGSIYDGTQRLFPFHQGFSFAKNDRFATLNIPPGLHDFAAWYGSHPTSGHHLAITLEPGKQYFFRAQSESRGIVEIEIEHGRLDQVTCQIAHEEAPNAKPIEIKHPSPNFISMHVPLQSMPSCTNTNPSP
ncbi:hypothetical protein [Tunturiibacter gelidoferens]|uniref:DUF2846 domain-containing protein n=2 Tax=Tunturiibacter TaxID=3154218 RepID=A0A7Y9NNJ0_9BACT|nr:hypothetical protein [Edaphobacter lichenicola]MBB5338150.1 hypothetical protein [Edaphobacter lichenicola]NYF52596.1 hypothetical protein [Edaphobacter lichenicola]